MQGAYSDMTMLHGPGVDDSLATFALPFSFPMYCQTYPAGTAVAVSSNGWLTFQPSTITGVDNQDMSAPCAGCAPPGAIVAPFWTDLVVATSTTGSGVFYSSWSAAGAAAPTLVRIEFCGMADYAGSVAGINFQVCRQAMWYSLVED